MIVTCNGWNIDVGFATMKVHDYEGMKVKKVRNGFCVVIRECGWGFRDKRHKIYFKTAKDTEEYIKGIAYVLMYDYRILKKAEVPTGYLFKQELKQKSGGKQ